MKPALPLKTLLLIGACCSSLYGQDAAPKKATEVDFRLKYEPGKTYLTEFTGEQNMVMTMGGQEVKTELATSISRSSAAKAHEKGVEVTDKIERMTMDMNAAGQAMKFDSQNLEGPLAAMMKPLIDGKTTFIFDKEGKLIELSVPEIPNGKALGMDKETLELSAREMTDKFPNKVVKVGEKWTSTIQMPLPGLIEAPLKIEYEMLYLGMEELNGHEVARVKVGGTVNGGDENIKVKSKKIDGVIFFEPAIGQIRETTMEMDLEIGLPEGVPVEPGSTGTMPMTMKYKSSLKEVK